MNLLFAACLLILQDSSFLAHFNICFSQQLWDPGILEASQWFWNCMLIIFLLLLLKSSSWWCLCVGEEDVLVLAMAPPGRWIVYIKPAPYVGFTFNFLTMQYGPTLGPTLSYFLFHSRLPTPPAMQYHLMYLPDCRLCPLLFLMHLGHGSFCHTITGHKGCTQIKTRREPISPPLSLIPLESY